jgi:protein-S-isoprenylcysteine O-methyltransferase Ste14
MRSGPYAIVRHPSYLGALVAIIGSGIFLNAPIGTALAAVFMSMAYWARLKAEEEVLSRTFGDEYEEYRKATPMIIPFINFHKRSTSFPSRDK